MADNATWPGWLGPADYEPASPAEPARTDFDVQQAMFPKLLDRLRQRDGVDD